MGSLHFSDIRVVTSLCAEFDMLDCVFFVTCISLPAWRCSCIGWLTFVEVLLIAIKCLLIQVLLPKETHSFLLGLFEKITKGII